jgi:hypothetical protein
MRSPWRLKPLYWLGLIALGGVALRLFVLRTGRALFDSDQAIFAVGALRILRTGERHVLIPGQFYGADLLSDYFALWHLFFQPGGAVMRIGMLVLCALLWVAVFCAVRAATGNVVWALVSMAAAAVSPSMITDWSFRSSNVHLLSLVCLFFGLALLFQMVRERPVWGTRRHVVMGAAMGFVFGVGYWSHPVMLVFIAGVGLGVVLQPRLAGEFLGLQRGEQFRGRLLSNILQLAMIAGLMFITWALLAGAKHFARPGSWVPSGSKLAPYGLMVLALVVVRVLTSWRYERHLLRPRLGILYCTVALWIGALPILFYVWVWKQPYMEVTSTHRDFGVVAKQFASIFTTGIPVLLGYYHNWAQVPTVPLWLRVAALFINFASMPITLLFAWRTAGTTRVCAGVFAALFAVQVVAFSLSTSGFFIIEPRYVQLLYFIFAVTFGGAVAALWQRGRIAGKVVAVFACALLLTNNVWSNLAVVPAKTVGWSGMEVRDRDLIQALEKKGIRHVSTRFSPEGYWFAYKLAYLSKEKVLFAPEFNGGTYIRSAEYQRAVESSTNRAYLVRPRERWKLQEYLKHSGAKYEQFTVPGYTVFYNLQPDVLTSLKTEDYFAMK